MTLSVKQLNRLVLLSLAPFIGLSIWLVAANASITLPSEAFPRQLPQTSVSLPAQTETILTQLDQAKQTAIHTASSIKRTIKLYHATNDSMAILLGLPPRKPAGPLLSMIGGLQELSALRLVRFNRIK